MPKTDEMTVQSDSISVSVTLPVLGDWAAMFPACKSAKARTMTRIVVMVMSLLLLLMMRQSKEI
jgi:hypothetical protein